MRTRPLLVALLVVLALTAVTVALVVRIERVTGSNSHDFLLWDLFLAWIPLLLALALELRRRTGRFGVTALVLGGGWLLFLPNAPYLLTDFVHFGRRNPAVSPRLDFAALSCGAVAGALVGLLSLLLVQRAVRERLGSFVSWALAAVTLTLASFGIYLGRVVRLNSWDVVSRPRLLAAVVRERLADPLAHPRMVAGTLAMTGLLLAAYVVFYWLAAGLERADRNPRAS